jgi:hypothetical protein
LGVEGAATATEQNVDDGAKRMAVTKLVLGNGVEVSTAIGVGGVD